jgi:ParB family chromosome partitioning protein
MTKKKVANEFMSISLKRIKVDNNTRSKPRSQDLQELMKSMKESGLINPITVAPGGGSIFVVIAGHRRFYAAKKLGWDNINCHIMREGNSADNLIKTIAENEQRKTVNGFEQGRFIVSLMEKENMSRKEVAARLGVKEQRVQMFIDAFRDLPEKYRDCVVGNSYSKAGEISVRSASVVLGLQKSNLINRKQSESLLGKIKSRKIMPQELNNLAKNIRKGNGFNEIMKFSSNLRSISVRITMLEPEYQRLFKKGSLSEYVRDLVYGENDRKPLKRPCLPGSSKE